MKQSVKDKDNLLFVLKENSSKIKSYGVESLSLFGSFAKGVPNAESDVDLLVNFAPHQKSYDNFMELSFFLEDLLGRRVEIVTPQSLNKHIGPHILNSAEYVAI
ncbi:nucleotidyltransferase [Arachidicoccus ginsenosidimutans]|uniref:nucleotidyltransferase family protein n=1 Tax=Arachidicoccus sp. BS20 TaxID=1850526 RepID=UPI0007F14F41|nr:nucleotidyltransferase family protein [Arachidicoccus sp. BS20]ANI88822.1 nucleotidyltransferase [Arachidicoccus sp. BS20]